MRLVTPSVIVLVGPSGAGKSTWARAHFEPNEVVSSDDLRATVGIDRDDQRAGTDAFFLLDEIVRRRVARKLTTVIDSTGLDADRRAEVIGLGRAGGLPVFAVGFDTPPDTCRARNAERPRPIPKAVLSRQLSAWKRTRPLLDDEGFDAVEIVTDTSVATAHVVPPSMAEAPLAARAQREEPVAMRFGLQLSSFPSDAPLRRHVASVAEAAESAGFDSIWVMDHFRQIPQIGREWEPMPESYTTLAFMAAVTKRVKLGTLVTGVGYRNIAHLGKIVATLDVLSAGRAICGLGIGWFEREAKAYGLDFPRTPRRYDLLEDALRLLPLLWGPGSPFFEGKVVSVPEAMCYPRPIQDRIPILVGGAGERRTLPLVARHAQLCNFFGDADSVRRKSEVLAGLCEEIDRDPAEITVSHLGPVLVGADQRQVADETKRLRPRAQSPAEFAASVNAGSVEDHIGRFRGLADAGVGLAIVAPAGGATVESVEAMAPVIAAFG
ncbi:MAG TPA: TIGR03560 family F420-dependent LLM class oxidoreductase [Acidimicrobiia bacterium]|jgi:F420-dependent oxidoreductase-like protein